MGASAGCKRHLNSSSIKILAFVLKTRAWNIGVLFKLIARRAPNFACHCLELVHRDDAQDFLQRGLT